MAETTGGAEPILGVDGDAPPPSADGLKPIAGGPPSIADFLVNGCDVLNDDYRPGVNLMFGPATKHLVEKWDNNSLLLPPIKFDPTINYQTVRNDLDLPQGFVFNPDPRKKSGLHYRAVCKAIGTMNSMIYNPLQFLHRGQGHVKVL